MFDDADKGIEREPFVEGMPAIIEHALHDEGIYLDAVRYGFTLSAATDAFDAERLWGVTEEYARGEPAKKQPGRRRRTLRRLHFQRPDGGGARYIYHAGQGYILEGWLCPVLHHYFTPEPRTIFFTVGLAH